jgi:hypothetical protein
MFFHRGGYLNTGKEQHLTRHKAHLGPVDPDVQGVLLQDHPVHRPIHRQHPGLHHAVLILNKLLERFSRNLRKNYGDLKNNNYLNFSGFKGTVAPD